VVFFLTNVAPHTTLGADCVRNEIARIIQRIGLYLIPSGVGETAHALPCRQVADGRLSLAKSNTPTVCSGKRVTGGYRRCEQRWRVPQTESIADTVFRLPQSNTSAKTSTYGSITPQVWAGAARCR